ncbi:GGDEF domain-containing protein [Pigmentiphaga soli]|uniref:diguanylate cyclase n=1 Tax=Pigmentiphaga soli TaxID=1007095 RepID=A0ABP8GKV3_9BURK
MPDPVSILIVTILSALMSLAVLGSLLPAGIPGVRYWFGGNMLSILSFVLFALQRQGPPIITILGANGTLALTVLLMLQGCRRFIGQPPVVWAEYGALLLVLAGLWYWTYVDQDINARIVLVSAFHAYVYLSIAWLVRKTRPAERPYYAYRFLSIAAFIGGLGHTFRGLIYATGLARQTELLQSNQLNIVFLALGILALPCLSIGMVMLAHDRMARRLEQMANLDELTGILARRACLAQADAALRAAQRSGRPLSVAIIDIDHFKVINDTHGHAAGDKVLAHFSASVARSLRASDVFGRLGGEEFIIVFPETRRDEAAAALDRLRQELAKTPCLLKGGSVAYTFSVGVDECQHGETLASLMGRADAALYAAKRQGRDRVVAAWEVPPVPLPARHGAAVELNPSS